jgi:ribosomal protein S12 methylthiotransferase
MKIGLVSLGCPKNLVDSEVMLGLAQQAGHHLTRNAADADVIVVNTCAFIDRAKQESIDTILEMAQHKRTGACRRLVVTGCMAERYRDELRKEIPEIDALLGTGEVPDIVSALGSPDLLHAQIMPSVSSGGGLPHGGDARAEGSDPASANSREQPFSAASHGSLIQLVRANGEPITTNAHRHESRHLPTYIYDADTPRVLATPRHYAYIKIAEGCDYKCAFCIIPTLRGRYRSRPAHAIVREAQSLAARGVRELLLISQDTTFYGVDAGQRGALARLLGDLNRVDGLEWIRLLYLYPTTITDDVLDAIGDSEKVCKYIDLPLQHAADEVLRRMKRPGTRAGYERLLRRIRVRLPGVTLRTTFIVGFPGETAAEFAQLQSFVEDVQFDHVGVFTYSHEEGTSAYALPDDISATVKARRQSSLMAAQKRLVARRHKARIGERVRMLVDGPSDEHELVLRGRLEGHAPQIDPVVYLTECDPSALGAGQFVDAEITGSRGYDLVARPLSLAVPV